jgi:hypothetical protein
MPDDAPSPAPLSDQELRETLNMVGTVVASVSDRVDSQTTAMNGLIKTATEARQAAFAAQKQTDPEHYGELIGATIDGKINDNLVRMGQMCVDLFQAANRAQDALKQAEQDKWDILNDIRERESQVARWKTRLPWFGLGAVLLMVALTVTLPRFSAINSTTCAVFGGELVRTTEGNSACVHYQD